MNRLASSLLVLSTACGLSEKPVLSDVLWGSCDYPSRFTGEPECRDYLGEWTAEQFKQLLESTIPLTRSWPFEVLSLGWGTARS